MRMLAMLKRILGTLAALVVAGLLIIGVVMILAQQSWNANPLREQLAVAAESVPQDPWTLSDGERDAIIQQLDGAVYTDSETGQIKWVSSGGLEGWTVLEPLRDYEYTGAALVQSPRWYYPLCYDGVLYVLVTAKAQDLPEDTSPVPPAEECEWTWELVRDESNQVLPGWYSLRMALEGGDNDFAVINTEDYAMLYASGPACGMAMWENAVHTGAGEYSNFSFSMTNLLEGVQTADANNAYPLV